LTGDNWDDYGYKTTFHLYIFKNNEKYGSSYGFSRKILFKDQEEGKYSSSILDNLFKNKSYIKFIDIYKRVNYISLGSEYKELRKIYPDNFDEILKVLNDVIYLEKYFPKSDILKLKEHPGFEISLCRDQSAKKLLEEGKNILYDEIIDPKRFEFNFDYLLNEKKYKFKLDFKKDVLPYRINIVIGKNGVGKTKFLEILVNYFLKNKKSKQKYDIQVNKYPNFISNVITISFSVYESFPNDYKLDENDKKKKIAYDVKDYIYLGYRNEQNHINPKIIAFKAFMALKKIYDKDFDNFNKETLLYNESLMKRLIRILNNAFDCKYIGIEDNNQNIIYFSENLDFKNKINFDLYTKFKFYDKNKNEIYLSAGQNNFANLIISIVGYIKPNSLIIIDEPENTLHPNYEIDFMRILFNILEEFDSFAIIATHSTIITREVPNKYVNIIKFDSNGEVVVLKPSIQTFGANIMDISDFVFDDVFKENKPYENWLKKQIQQFDSFDDFYKKYKKILSYDFLLQAKNIWDELNDKD